MNTQSNAMPQSPATLRHGRWHDAKGSRIEGPAPLAQLGVGGSYVDPKGRTLTITDITKDERGFVFVTCVPQ